MKMLWAFCVLVVAVASRVTVAFPQNSFEVDGFVFDGPADRPVSQPIGMQRGTPPPPQRSSPPPVLPDSTTSTTTTALPGVDLDACVARCPVTPEYNPVCGTDNMLYGNPGSLNCASICGKDVRLNYYGPCTTGRG